MKPSKLLVICILSTGCLTTGAAQEQVLANTRQVEQLSKLHRAVEKLDTAENLNTLAELATEFNRLRQQDQENWLPYYYEAYTYLKLALRTPNLQEVDPLCDKANAVLEALNQTFSKNTEAMCLQALERSSRIRVNMMGRGPMYSVTSNKLLEMALEMDPGNPRAQLLKGQNVFYMPSVFGGGKENAKKYFEKAIEAFGNVKDRNFELPHWGYESAVAMLEKCRD